MTFVQMFTFVLIALVMLVESIFLMCPLFLFFSCSKQQSVTTQKCLLGTDHEVLVFVSDAPGRGARRQQGC